MLSAAHCSHKVKFSPYLIEKMWQEVNILHVLMNIIQQIQRLIILRDSTQ